jgi:hypothetical protein
MPSALLQWAIDQWAFRCAARSAVRTASATSASAADEAIDQHHDARDIVLVPCWRRPEMLWHCIDNLCRADGIESMHVLFRPDSGHDPDTLNVIRSFAARLPSYEIQPAPRCPYRRTKLSANILLGYLQAAARARRYVYMIEEDIMIGRDFFRWHAKVQSHGSGVFCSIAVRNHNRRVVTPHDPDGYYLTSGDYCSWGVCFDRFVIGSLIAPHVNLAYLSQPKRYLRRHFEGSRVDLGFVEQASLLRRVQEISGRPIAYPAVPRAYHAGFYGRNRPGGVQGRLTERIRRLESVIYDPVAMRGLALTERYAADSQPECLNVIGGGGIRQLKLRAGHAPGALGAAAASAVAISCRSGTLAAQDLSRVPFDSQSVAGTSAPDALASDTAVGGLR